MTEQINWNDIYCHTTSTPLALSTSCQSSSQITAPVPSSSVNSPSNLPHPHTVCIYLSCSFAPQYLNLHIHLLHILPFLYCNYFSTMAYLLPYLSYPTSFAHIVYRLVYTVLLTVCLFYSMCNSVLLCVELLCFILARSQL